MSVAPAQHGLIDRLSITAKLTLLYTLAAFGMMLMTTASQYWFLTRGLETDELRLVIDRVRVLDALLRKYGENPPLLDFEIRLEGSVNDDDQLYVFYSRIMDDRQRIIIETSGMSGLLPIEAFPSPIELPSTDSMQVVERWEDVNGQTYFIIAARVPSIGRDGPPRVIQVAMGDIGESKIVAGYRRDSLILLALGTLFFAIVGSFIARRSLRPVAAIARTAEHINANRLSARVMPENWPLELVALAQAFDQMLARLEASFNRMSESAEDMAHELRTPLHNLMIQAEVALSRERQPEEYRQILESSLEEYSRLSKTIRALLFLARADNPQTEIDRCRFDVQQELLSIKEFFEIQAEEQGVDVVSMGQSEVEADKLLFQQAVGNLVSNALRFTPQGGRITLATNTRDDHSVDVTVTDTGHGIPPEHMPKIFDRFYRVDSSAGLSGVPKNSGLGLAIVKSIMKLHGGTVDVESSLEKGTVVSLRFPVIGATWGTR